MLPEYLFVWLDYRASSCGTEVGSYCLGEYNVIREHDPIETDIPSTGGMKTGFPCRCGYCGELGFVHAPNTFTLTIQIEPEVLLYLVIRDAPRHRTNCLSPHLVTFM